MINLEQDPVYLTAADWFARLREPEVSVEDMLAWQQWLSESEQHAQAFAQIERVSATLRHARRPALPPVTEDMHDRYDASVPLSAWVAPRRRPLALAASILVAGVAVGWILLQQGSTNELRTAVGENRTLTLADGSTVVLGGNTRLEVALDGKMRHLELIHGEAFFTVAKDPTRPFKVLAGDATVVAVGTGFNVRLGADRTVVAVTEGRVIVEATAAGMPLSLLQKSKQTLPVPLIAGEQTIVSATGIVAPTRSADSTAVTAWQSGRLTFQLETLRHVLEDVNRYAPKPIVVEDETVADLKITATVVNGNVTGLITSIEKAFDLTAVEEAGRILLQRKASVTGDGSH